MLELQTIFVDNECSNDALRTQIAALRDLAFFREWCLLRAGRDKSWIPPETRALRERRALSPAETRDFARWSQRDARSIVIARQSSGKPLVTLPNAKTVETATSNRRLRTCKRYLKWLTLLAASTGESDSVALLAEAFCSQLDQEFAKYINEAKKPGRPKSLEHEQRKTLRKIVDKESEEIYGKNANGRRDKLIARLLFEGVRAGELLKATTCDLDDRYEIGFGRWAAVIRIERRPNDPDDERVIEPAVKTLPGMLPIGKRLMADLIEYVRNDRRSAVDRRRDERETHQLFVNHTGAYIGRATSQRNLNRIVGRLKGQSGLPNTIAPHTFRHTHMEEVEEVAAKKGSKASDVRKVLLQRGRWGPKSTMPELYTHRATMEASAEIIERRDEILHSSEA